MTDVGTILGFDFGMKHIGVAVGSGITQQAQGLQSLKAKDGIPNWEQLLQLVKQWGPQELAVGIPINMDGSDIPHLTLCAKKFAKRLKHHSALPVAEVDERLTTQSAKSELFERKGYKALKKKAIDSQSAVLIVEQYLHDQ